MTEKREASLFEALLPILILIILLSINFVLFDDTLAGSNQIALMLAASIAGIISYRLGFCWEKINESIVSTIGSAMPAILILLLIGSLAGTWMISGVVPAMIYYGLEIINPRLFLFTAVVVSSIVSIATGSSWSTIATIGVALIGIGKAIGLNEAMVAGAIVSGAYFGDKMSPLSDTTNLAPAMAGTDIFTHIRYMLYTTVPSMTIALIIYLIIGLNYNFSSTIVDVENVKNAIIGTFNISPLLFLVPIILFTVILLKVPPLPAMFIGIILGGIFAIIFQPNIIKSIANNEHNYMVASYVSVMQAIFGEITLSTSDTSVTRLLSTSGMQGMLDTVWLILSAMVFGGVMESAGLLKRVTKPIIKYANNTGGLITSTVITCIFFNATASDQYISIVVPGRMFRSTFKDKGYKPELLSRTLEDSGTVTSVLIPWNSGGATQARVLGVPTLAYAPYAFFNLISPLMTILFAYLNIKIRRLKDNKKGNNTIGQ